MGEGRRLRGGRAGSRGKCTIVKKRIKLNTIIVVSLDKMTRGCLNKYMQKAVENKTFSR